MRETAAQIEPYKQARAAVKLAHQVRSAPSMSVVVAVDRYASFTTVTLSGMLPEFSRIWTPLRVVGIPSTYGNV